MTSPPPLLLAPPPRRSSQRLLHPHRLGPHRLRPLSLSLPLPTAFVSVSALQVARFWLQHIVKTVQAHPAAGAGCWPELCAAASDMYRHIASCGYAATGAGAAAAGASGQPGSQQPGAGAGPGAGAAASPHARAAQDLESVVMLKLTSLIAMTLEAAAPVLAWSGFPAAGAPPAGPGTGGQQPGLVAAMLPASQHDIQVGGQRCACGNVRYAALRLPLQTHILVSATCAQLTQLPTDAVGLRIWVLGVGCLRCASS